MQIEIALYKNGDSMGTLVSWFDSKKSDALGGQIYEHAEMHDLFKEHYPILLGALIDSGIFYGDWEFQLRYWLPQYYEILRKTWSFTRINLADFSGVLRLVEGNIDGCRVAYMLSGEAHVMPHEPELKMIDPREYDDLIKELKNKLLQRDAKIIELETALARRDE
jgi:hypothetical protein